MMSVHVVRDGHNWGVQQIWFGINDLKSSMDLSSWAKGLSICAFGIRWGLEVAIHDFFLLFLSNVPPSCIQVEQSSGLSPLSRPDAVARATHPSDVARPRTWPKLLQCRIKWSKRMTGMEWELAIQKFITYKLITHKFVIHKLVIHKLIPRESIIHELIAYKLMACKNVIQELVIRGLKLITYELSTYEFYIRCFVIDLLEHIHYTMIS